MIKRNPYLTDYVVDQYPIDKFTKLIFITLDIVENFLLVLESGFNYNSTSIASYSEKYGSHQKNTNSKIESMMIKNINEKKKMKKFLNVYYDAYNALSNDEKNMFDATFIYCMTDNEIFDKYSTYCRFVTKVRRSAIIKFSLRAGLDKFVDLV